MSKRRSKTDYRGPRVCIFLPARAPLNYVRLPPPPPTSSPAPYHRHTKRTHARPFPACVTLWPPAQRCISPKVPAWSSSRRKKKREIHIFWYPSENRAGQANTISCLLPSLNCASKGGLRAPSSCVSSALPAYLSSLESYSPKTSAQMVGSALCSLHSLSSS